MVKFGVHFHQEDFSFEQMKGAWKEAESLGFDSVWIYDHFYPVKFNSKGSILEAWTLLPVLAAETDRIRFGVGMTCNTFRNSSVLAKIATTVDVMSDGRLEFGIGAGWNKDECLSYGIPFSDGKTRVAQLAESIEIIRRIWTQEKANFIGKYHSISNLVSYPKPIQKPHPPIWIGGQRNMILRVAAEYADYVTMASQSPREYGQRLDVLGNHCNELGRKYNDIEKSYYVLFVIDNDEKEAVRLALEKKSQIVIKKRREMNVQKFLEKTIAGTADQCIKRIEEYIEAGVSYFIINFLPAPSLKPLHVFINNVASSF